MEFAAATAAATGESKRRINEQLAIARALGDNLQRVEGTSLDKGVELQALAKLQETSPKGGSDAPVSTIRQPVPARRRLRPGSLHLPGE